MPSILVEIIRRLPHDGRTPYIIDALEDEATRWGEDNRLNEPYREGKMHMYTGAPTRLILGAFDFERSKAGYEFWMQTCQYLDRIRGVR